MESKVSINDRKESNFDDPTAEIGAEHYDTEREMSKDELLDLMLKEYKLSGRRSQRRDDTDGDNGLRLFSRQKNQSRCVIFSALLLLTAVYALQLVCMYNLFKQARNTTTLTLAQWFERGYLISPKVVTTDPEVLHASLRQLAKSIEGDTFDIDVLNLPKIEACFTPVGYTNAVYNVAAGLVLMYAFLFFEMWCFIMQTSITRSFPGRERNGLIMILGEIWLVLLNSAVVVWLGVICGYTVLASCVDFYLIMNTAFQLFIIIAIDDTILPGVRYLVEEHGHIDVVSGELKEDQLKLLTHGKQYYKPGYGHRWAKNFRNPSMFFRVIAYIMFVITVSIVFVPFGIICYNASTFIIPCA